MQYDELDAVEEKKGGCSTGKKAGATASFSFMLQFFQRFKRI